jgi:hypothetical protein
VSRTRAFLLLLFFGLAGCRGPGRVEFSGGQCLIDGHVATRAEVESRQARITERILSRQPLFVLITVLIVALAGMSHVEKLFLFAGKKDQPVRSMHDRLRLALERYRSHPLRYFSMVALTLGLLGVAGGVYVYLDSDKRASERALGLLQFCHIALRNDEAAGILAEQKQNLQQIESTAGDIRAFVGKLPPEEQKKARQIVARINDALAQQGRLVGDYVARTDESTKAVREETQLLGKGLTSLETQVTTLKAVPTALRDLAEQLRGVDGHVTAGLGDVQGKLAATDGKLTATAARLASVEAKLDAVTVRLDGLEAAGKTPTSDHKPKPPEPPKVAADVEHKSEPFKAAEPLKAVPPDLGASASH